MLKIMRTLLKSKKKYSLYFFLKYMQRQPRALLNTSIAGSLSSLTQRYVITNYSLCINGTNISCLYALVQQTVSGWNIRKAPRWIDVHSEHILNNFGEKEHVCLNTISWRLKLWTGHRTLRCWLRVEIDETLSYCTAKKYIYFGIQAWIFGKYFITLCCVWLLSPRKFALVSLRDIYVYNDESWIVP